MLAQKLKTVDFRNSKYNEIEFSPGVNVIYGENAAGKTNILEAIFMLAAGKSFRGSKDKELIRFGCDAALCELAFSDRRKSGSIGMKLYKGRKKEIFRNGNQVTKMAEFLGEFRAVIFTPDHMNLVKGQPENRRRFMDFAICQSFPRYVSYLNDYNRLMAQKNALLHQDCDDLAKMPLIEIYNEKISAAAAAIAFNRRKFLKLLEKDAAAEHLSISGGKEQLSLHYNCCVDGESESAEELRKRMQSYFESKTEIELRRRMCLFGVHKDDITININGNNARFYASQGQQRSAVLSMKLAEGEMSHRITGEHPVFLFDDILSELDEERKAVILSKTAGRQVILTGCEQSFFDSAEVENRIKIENGVCVKG